MSQYLEKQIAKQCIADLLAAGYVVSVNDGEEITLRHSRDANAIFGAMFTTDEDWLIVSRSIGGDDNSVGWVRFIYGNSGYDVINDYTINLEAALAKTMALADEMEG